METDLHSKAVHLLEKIANSMYERDKSPNIIWSFTSAEVLVVEKWLKDFIDEQKSPQEE
jgi:hypothetical protein